MNNQKDQRAQNALNFKNGRASQNFCGKVPSYQSLKELLLDAGRLKRHQREVFGRHAELMRKLGPSDQLHPPAPDPSRG